MPCRGPDASVGNARHYPAQRERLCRALATGSLQGVTSAGKSVSSGRPPRGCRRDAIAAEADAGAGAGPDSTGTAGGAKGRACVREGAGSKARPDSRSGSMTDSRRHTVRPRGVIPDSRIDREQTSQPKLGGPFRGATRRIRARRVEERCEVPGVENSTDLNSGERSGCAHLGRLGANKCWAGMHGQRMRSSFAAS